MSRESLEADIASRLGLVLDTSVVLAYLSGNELASPAATVVVDEFVYSGRNLATICSVTVAETLVRPIRAGPGPLDLAEQFLRHFPNLTIEPISYEIAREAARLRAETALRTPDSLVIATALVHDIPIVVANDGRWRSAIAAAAPGLSLCHLASHVPI